MPRGFHPVVDPVDPLDSRRVEERLLGAAAVLGLRGCRVRRRPSVVYRRVYILECRGLTLEVFCEESGCLAVARREGRVARCSIVCSCVYPPAADCRGLEELAARLLATAGIPAESGTLFWRSSPGDRSNGNQNAPSPVQTG